MMASDFIALILAAGALVDLWWNSELVEDQRASVEAHAMLDEPPFWARLFSCPYCLSHWTSGLLAALLLLSLAFLPAWAVMLVRVPVYSLAIARGAFLLEGALPDRLRYRRELLIMEEESDDDTGEWENKPSDTQSPAAERGDTAGE